MIVDSDADLDDAVPAIVSSAFVYAGQKCSAAARVLVHEAIADQLIERVAGAARVLVVGQAEELGTDVPPVIEQTAQERVDRYAALAREQGEIVARVESVPDRGWFCPPTVVAGLPRDSPVLNEEIFGPLLAIDRVANVEDACDVVDALPYALTGGLFARDPGVRPLCARAHSSRQSVREPGHHRGNGRTSTVWRQPPVRHREQGRGAGLPTAVRRASRGHREHDAPRARGVAGSLSTLSGAKSHLKATFFASWA